jgi:NAD+ synthase (glutamine-hydrolysing)
MPTQYNSNATKDIARLVCEELGVGFKELPIEDAFTREVEAAQAMLPTGKTLDRLTIQNIQARIRGMRMWNWSNSARGLWLQTGNMSEKAVGYTTIGGDLMGGYALLGNMPKTVVNGLLAYLQTRYGWQSLKLLLQTAASAELAEDQEDERDLMPFAVLDACFELFAGEKLLPDEMYARLRARFTDDDLRALHPAYTDGMLRQWMERFLNLFMHSIYKWVQAPQAVHLYPLDLDRERALQLPVIQSQEWLKIS